MLVAACTSPQVKNQDPNDPAAWAEAESLARSVLRDTVVRRKTLPFFFEGDHGGHVLIHRGTITHVRGPIEVGTYLRDLGIVDGTARLDPFELAVFLEVTRALPDVPDTQPTSFFLSSDRDELNVRTETDGTTGRVVLHYMMPDPPEPAGIDRGDSMEPTIRTLVRADLEIPRVGDARWRLTRFLVTW
jgi:hypothetical protein